MACLLVVASLLVILPPPPFQFFPLAPYCCTHLLGWHPSAPPRLAPYCYSPAGILLLIVVGWHPLCPVSVLASLSLLFVALLLGYTQSCYCTASVAAPNALDRPM